VIHMKLSELLLEERSKDYLSRLVKSVGVKKLGKGVYSHVFQHPVYRNVAVKVVLGDVSYIAFLRQCLKHQGNRWLPNIVSMHEIDLHDDATDAKLVSVLPPTSRNYIVFFEKLSKASAKKIRDAFAEVIGKGVLTAKRQSYLTENELRMSFDGLHQYDWEQIMKKHPEKDVRDLASVLLAVSQGDNQLDIHDANVMVRGNGQLVFTDPVAS
jgi:hypothetical protein